jgi:hypothetical protein
VECTQCNAIMINGVYCHEQGCHNSYKNEVRECKWCGSDFQPETRDQEFCDVSCYHSYNGTGVELEELMIEMEEMEV